MYVWLSEHEKRPMTQAERREVRALVAEGRLRRTYNPTRGSSRGVFEVAP